MQIPNKTKVRYGGHNGYVACYDPRNRQYLLRLDGFNGDNGDIYWHEDWYPESEKKDEHNCWWAIENEFEVIEEPQLILKDDTLKSMQKKSNKLNNKIMSKIIKFAKDLTLSTNDKELRKANLQDEDGDWTEDAERIVRDLVAKENGFKNAEKMANKYGKKELLLSVLELRTAFTKYYDQLLDIAKKYNKENK